MTIARQVEFIPWTELRPEDFQSWRKFAAERSAPPDLQPEWVEALLHGHEIPAAQVEVLRVTEAGECLLLSPIRAHLETMLRIPSLVVEPLQSVFALHQTLLSNLSEVETVRLFFDAIESRHPGWTVLRMRQLVEHSALASAWLAEAAARSLPSFTEPGHRQPYLEMSTDWESYVKNKSANFRSNLKRKARKLESAGEVAVEFIEQEADMVGALQAIQAIETWSWKAESGTSLTVRPWEARFYETLIRGFSRHGHVLVTILRIDGAPVAYDLSVTGAGRAYCLKTSFDSRFRDLSPGQVMREKLMARLFARGLKEYDFLGKDERYKLEWASGTRREMAAWVINRSTVKGHILTLLKKFASLAGNRTALARAQSRDEVVS